jgi:hypothetical protein
MFDIIFETYNISNYDTRAGNGITLKPDPVLGVTVGSERPMYPKEIDDEYDDEDVYVDDADIDAIGQKLNNPVFRTDAKRSVVGLGSQRLHLEFADHTTTISKGISPRLTYRGGQKGPAFGTQSSATYIRNRPGRKSGTQYGTSRAPIDVEMDEPLMFGENPPDKMERSFLKHQKKMMNINKDLDALEDDKKAGHLEKKHNMYRKINKKRRKAYVQ